MEMIIKTDQQGNLKYNFLAQIYDLCINLSIAF